MSHSHKVIYSFDACSIIYLATTFYPIDIFPSIWSFLDKMIKNDQILIIDTIYEEIKIRDDDAKQFFEAKERKSKILCKSHELEKIDDMQDMVKKILANNDKIIDNTKGKNWWDPWLISFAKSYNLTIVTNEAEKKKWSIPNICLSENIKCIDLLWFFREIWIKI